MVEEDLLIDHPIDCPICDKAGECLLQDYHFQHGQKERRADIKPFTSRRREMGDTVTLFVDRCVMCSRCVRFCREISGTSELMVINRGSHEEIDVFPGHPLDNKLAGNVVDLCPVGALGDKDFLYQQRVWFMKRHAHVCAGCSTGCSVFIEENQDQIYRLKPRENPGINQWWMCDEGRYGYHHVHSDQRQIGAYRREQGKLVAAEWHQVLADLPAQLRAAGPLAAVLSPHLTVEEAYLLARLAREIDAEAVIAVGPIPVIAQDERFQSGFVIHAEKCPNRRGVEEIAKHFTEGPLVTFERLLPRIEAGEFGGLWFSGGYKTHTIDENIAAKFARLKALVVQDLFDSPLWQRATHALAGAAWAEREGSYVNYKDILQSFRWAIRPPAGARVEGSVYWQLLEMPGMYKASAVLPEIAATIPFFAGAVPPIPEAGVDLRANLLASVT
jgi:NADH-quinone oxidoreductase subunit G